MKITFVSNYINHQIPLAEELYAALGDDYRFIETEEMEQERIQMGWNSHTKNLPYLLQYYEKPQECEKLIADSDLVVFGTDDESYIQGRLRAGKPVIRCSERLYKEGQWKAISPRGLRKKYEDHTQYRNSPVYLLCAGAYVPSDFRIVRAYPENVSLGIFPPFAKQDVDSLLDKKRANKKQQILWSGRFLDWKHPMDALYVASCLKKEGLFFELVMIGGGEEEEKLKEMIQKEGLEDCVRLTGFLEPQEVRSFMEQADIYLFTSDYKEGWGAVLNEAMNSGCAIVANVQAGATPYLIQHGKNGFIYKGGDREYLAACVKKLLKDRNEREYMGKNAYETIQNTWNAAQAAKALLMLCRKILGDEKILLPECGPGSKAGDFAAQDVSRLCKRKRRIGSAGKEDAS